MIKLNLGLSDVGLSISDFIGNGCIIFFNTATPFSAEDCLLY